MGTWVRRAGRVRPFVLVIVLFGVSAAVFMPWIWRLVYPQRPPQVVFDEASPDGEHRLVVVQEQQGRAIRNWKYVLQLTDAGSRPLPGADMRLMVDDNKRVREFSAKWSDRGVDVWAIGSEKEFVGFGRVVEGKQVWSRLPSDIVPPVPMEPLRSSTLPRGASAVED
jgi:hypothetical protein